MTTSNPALNLPHPSSRWARLGVLVMAVLWLPACLATREKAPSPSLAAAVAALSLSKAEVSTPGGPADFGDLRASREVRHIANWVMHSGDNHGVPFAVVDKRNARVFVFAPDGRVRGSSPVLLGAARGDHSVPGIGERPMEDIRPHERTTPAGRFVAEPGRNLNGEDIVWVDYDAAVSMHRVRATKPSERRLERLATGTARDNRISYGCINVPMAFYEKVVHPALGGKKRGIVYVLPEVRSVREVFGSYDVESNSSRQAGLGRNSRPPLRQATKAR